MPETIAIIQARMGASRLPGKVLLDLGGQPMLGRVLARVQRARLLDGAIVATTADVMDMAIEQFCRQRKVPVYRGSQYDVLDRYYQAACSQSAEVIVRITADCPVIDPGLIDATVELVIEGWPQNGVDFAATRLPPPWGRTYPIGLDVEVCTFTALERAWQEADQKYHREHVMPFLYEGVQLDTSLVARGTSARGFRIALLNHDPDYGALRWTVDTPADLELLRQVYAHFKGRDDFSWQEVLDLFEREPDLVQINAGVNHKTAFDVDARQEER
ncbi:MAG: glycosyltransferase family protein [Anaerolineales bacterium]|nr:glycosyltransferase family protein [Anaerolineales bacterium]